MSPLRSSWLFLCPDTLTGPALHYFQEKRKAYFTGLKSLKADYPNALWKGDNLGGNQLQYWKAITQTMKPTLDPAWKEYQGALRALTASRY